VVFCISKPYGNKQWTKVEFEAIRALKMQLSLSTAKSDRLRILPLRVGDGDVEGIFVNTICPDIREKPAAQTAELIINRLRLIRPDLDAGSASGETGRSASHLSRGMHARLRRPQQADQSPTDQGVLGRARIRGVADHEYPAEQYQTLLEQDLKGCIAFVQLIGRFPWKRGGFDRLQNEAAARLEVPRFRYRSAEIDLEKVEPSQREFLTAPDVIASGFEGFKEHLAKKLTVLAQQRERAPGARGDQDIPPLVVVAIRSPNPDALWERVFQWIYEQEGIDPYQLRPGETIDSRSQAEPFMGISSPATPRRSMMGHRARSLNNAGRSNCVRRMPRSDPPSRSSIGRLPHRPGPNFCAPSP